MCRPVTTTGAGWRISPGMTRFTGSPCRIRGPLPHPRHGPPHSCGQVLRRLHPERRSPRGVWEIRGCRPALRHASRARLRKHAERVLANPPVAGQRVPRQQVEGSGLPISVGRALRRHSARSMAARHVPPTSQAVGENINGQSPESAMRMRMKAWVTVSPPHRSRPPRTADPPLPTRVGPRGFHHRRQPIAMRYNLTMADFSRTETHVDLEHERTAVAVVAAEVRERQVAP